MGSGGSFSKMEKGIEQEVAKCATKIMSLYLEQVDRDIVRNKIGRRRSGYAIERRRDERKILTIFGEVNYHRTYYKRDSGGYEYLVDRAMGIDHRIRLSDWLSLSLVNAAKEMSYAKASRYTGKETVSSQSIMGRVRESMIEKDSVTIPRRKVPELHIDADEAHITLHSGNKSEVPLISVYEGIDHHGRRHYCREVFHISEYGKSPDDLWEQVVSEIDKRYDLEGTKIYLHGDGASWIRVGLEWLPRAVFVLDKYHKNKAIMAMTAGVDDKEVRDALDIAIRKALNHEDMEFFGLVTNSLCIDIPERRDIILHQANYLRRFVKGISICRRDPSANNGGCTEPHVSHVLSSRLSNRPMTWSKATLERLAPILAAGRAGSTGKTKLVATGALPKSIRKTIDNTNKAFHRYTLGLTSPEAIGTLPLLTGKVTYTQQVLKRIN
jgi:Uncharacterised protein family (UPF0236).